MDAREETKRRIAVMQAWVEGKKVEYRNRVHKTSVWRNEVDPAWDWDTYDYRIAPEPKVIWVNEYPGGLSTSWGSKDQAEKMSDQSRAIRIAVRYVEQPE